MGPLTQRFGRYVVLRPLAAGGMGEVLLAEQTGLSGFAKRVALKRIRAELADNPTYVQMFLNEARTGSFLNHPNIVHVFDVGQDANALFLVMEYVDGIDLKRLQRRTALAGHPLSGAQVAGVAIEVLSALEVAHRGPLTGSPIVHRDLSPENIIVTRSGQVKVLDFGLAKWWPHSPTVSALEGDVIFGKVRYMPPEQLRGHMIDGRADLFALGVVLYEALVGELPFGRGNANHMLHQILKGPPPSLASLRPDLPPGLDEVIQTAIDPDPGRRYPNAETMRDALVEVVRRSGQALPLEDLRRMLRSGSAKSAAAAHLPTPLAQHLPTQISLPVAERCGKCGGELKAYVVDDLIMDQCASCFGTWVDYGELERILGEGKVGPDAWHAGDPAPLDRVVGSCPVHRVGLQPLKVPGESVSLEVCPVCRGMWFDRDELKLLSQDHVVEWLRRELLDAE